MTTYGDPFITISLLAGIFFLAGVVKGGIGFGLPLVSVSLIAIFFPVELALAVNAVLLIVTNAMQFWMQHMMVETLRRFWVPAVCTVVGVFIGSFFVQLLDGNALKGVLGVGVFILTLMSLFSKRIHLPEHHEKAWGVPIGLMGGIVGVLTSAPGTIYALYLVGMRVDRRVFLSAFGFLSLFLGCTIGLAYGQQGFLGQDEFILALLCILPTLLGMKIGNRLAGTLSSDLFHRLVLIVLLFLSVNLAYSGFSAGAT